MHRQLKTYFILFLISMYSCRQENKELIVLPGRGIVMGHDTIKLSETTESEIFRLFKMKDTLIKLEHGSACGYDEEGNDVSWDTYFKDVNHDGIVFKYNGYTRKDSLILETIEITNKTHWTVKVNDSIILGKNMPNVLEYFPRQDSSDEYDNYSKDLQSYGINFGLDDSGLEKKLTYISIYKASRTEK